MKLKKHMVEVFIAFHDEQQAQLVLDTANRWAKCKDAYPTVIQISEKNFEIRRRVLADRLSKHDVYVIADVLCVPAQPGFVESVRSRFADNIGMAGLGTAGVPGVLQYPNGVRICRKGVINKWPTQITPLYNREHAESIKDTGKRVEMWSDILYHILGQEAHA